MDLDRSLNRIASIAVVVGALALAWQRLPGGSDGPRPTAEQADWKEYVGGSRLGSNEARVEIVVFSDYQCPFCAKLDSVIGVLQAERPGQIAVHVRHWPLQQLHSQARNAALASICADGLGQFAGVHAQLFRAARTLSDSSYGSLSLPTAGLRDSLLNCMKSEEALSRLRQDSLAAVALGVKGTPVVLVNGHRYHRSLARHELEYYLR